MSEPTIEEKNYWSKLQRERGLEIPSVKAVEDAYNRAIDPGIAKSKSDEELTYLVSIMLQDTRNDGVAVRFYLEYIRRKRKEGE